MEEEHKEEKLTQQESKGKRPAGLLPLVLASDLHLEMQQSVRH